MTQFLRSPIVGAEFDEFLYALIVEESDACPLTVLSALARLNMDPWDEAARLAQLPRETATQILDALVAALPSGPSPRPDSGALAARLVALLPGRTEIGGHSANGAPVAGIGINFQAVLSYYLIGMVLYMGVIWFMGPLHETNAPASTAPAARATVSRADAEHRAPATPAQSN